MRALGIGLWSLAGCCFALVSASCGKPAPTKADKKPHPPQQKKKKKKKPTKKKKKKTKKQAPHTTNPHHQKQKNKSCKQIGSPPQKF